MARMDDSHLCRRVVHFGVSVAFRATTHPNTKLITRFLGNANAARGKYGTSEDTNATSDTDRRASRARSRFRSTSAITIAIAIADGYEDTDAASDR